MSQRPCYDRTRGKIKSLEVLKHFTIIKCLKYAVEKI